MRPSGPSLSGNDWTPPLGYWPLERGPERRPQVVSDRLPDPFVNQVLLSCEATVAGERIQVRQAVVQAVYDDPQAREHIETAMREALIRAIVEKWTPVIRVRR